MFGFFKKNQIVVSTKNINNRKKLHLEIDFSAIKEMNGIEIEEWKGVEFEFIRGKKYPDRLYTDVYHKAKDTNRWRWGSLILTEKNGKVKFYKFYDRKFNS